MSQAPAVSVIIPTFNRRPTLPRAVESVLGQSFKNFELWIVDDGSTDGTWDWIWQQRDPRIRPLRLSTTGGVSRARNAAIARAQGQWIAFLDSDDEWFESKLERQLQLASQISDCPLIHSEEIWIRNGVRVNPKQHHAKSGGRIFERCLRLCCISPSAALVSRQIFSEVGVFREDFPVCEDYELWLRICARHSVGFVSDPLVIKYGGHTDQLSRRYVAMDYWRIKAMLPFLSDPSLSQQQRQAVADQIQSKAKILLKGYRKHGRSENVSEVYEIYCKASSLASSSSQV